VQVNGLFDTFQAFLEHILTTPEQIDLVVLDMEIPLHGLEVARRLRIVRPSSVIALIEEGGRQQ
jgi:DNA-binding response OmpR family regulator